MSTTFPVLELRPDGDVMNVNIKSAAAKPTLKDIQTYLKKKTAPTVLTSYPNGSKRVTIIGYTKGKDSEVSQQQLPPPYETSELYGSIILVTHPIKSTWDLLASQISIFTPVDYEVFYEKACSGDLDESEDIEGDDTEAIVDELDEDADAIVDADADDEAEDEAEDEYGEVDEEAIIGEVDDEAAEVQEVHHKVRVSRKAAKIDPQQLQFQFKSNLLTETEASIEAINSIPYRKQAYTTLVSLIGTHCSEKDMLDLELGIYNASLEEAKRKLVPLTWDHATFKWLYMMILKRTLANFQPNSYVANTELIERWKDGEFTLDTLGSWSPYDLKPSHWKDLKDQQFRRDKRISEGNLAMATDRFRCSQCKKKMCSYYELQTRSADEPMTIFISCLNCGKQWKQ
jgi:hypothetical protein